MTWCYSTMAAYEILCRINTPNADDNTVEGNLGLHSNHRMSNFIT